MMTPRSSPIGSAVTKALGEQPQHVEGADQIDVDDADKLGQRRHRSLPTMRCDPPMPAQFISTRRDAMRGLRLSLAPP